MKYDINVIRPRSSDYITGDSMDSGDVSAPTDGSPDVFVHDIEPFCNASQPNICENCEDTTTMTDGNDSSNSESSSSSNMMCPADVGMLPDFDALQSSSSSYMMCPADVGMLPDFDALQPSSSSYMMWTADVGMLPDFDALQSSSSSYMTWSADVGMLPDFDALQSSSSSYMACPADFDALLAKPLQTPVSNSDIDHTIDENHVLMREYCREIERNHVYQMINASESLEAMEEYVIEHELESGKFYFCIWFRNLSPNIIPKMLILLSLKIPNGQLFTSYCTVC